MHRKPLLSALERYKLNWLDQPHNSFEESVSTLDELIAFIQENPDCFERTLATGHITGAAVITTREFDLVLMTHHKKLNRWLQLGGHSDGDPDTASVSLREAQEESGLESFDFVTPEIFDIDIHTIPARANEPEHLHYDIRYLLQAREPQKIVISEESHDLKWFTLKDAYAATQERSMHRQFEKLEFLRRQLK